MKIGLIAPPWPLFNRPSIQVAVLKSFLSEKLSGVETTCFHPYLKVAATLGLATYDTISQSSWASEAVCASLLFPEIEERAARTFIRALRRRGQKADGALFKRVQRTVKDELDSFVLGSLDEYDLIGITASINQLMAAIYLARVIKGQWQEKRVILGGAGVSGPFGNWLERRFPEIDTIIKGEGELPLLRTVLAFQEEAHGSSTIAPEDGKGTAQLPDLNQLPLPDYSDCFKELDELPSSLHFSPVIPVEASRGCWWGRCNFCNLNLQWRGYRSKEPTEVVEEVLTLSKRYKVLDFAFMDNVLPRRECLEMFRRFAESGMDLHLFAEIRAVYSRKEIALMAAGGLREAQVGIEALSSSLLKRLGKGTRLMDNMATMRHLEEAGIKLGANLIVHFPGSTKTEAEETWAALDFAWPYQPLKTVPFWLGLGSPVFQRPREFGIKGLRPHRMYKGLFPSSLLHDLKPLIWEYRGDLTRQKELWLPIEEKVKRWRVERDRLRKKHGKLLTYRDGGEFLAIRQVLPDGTVLHHKLPSLARSIYLSCLDPQPLQALLNKHQEQPADRLIKWLNGMIERRLMFAHDGEVLSLAVADSNISV